MKMHREHRIPGNAWRRRAPAAFTLVEVLIALGIMSLILLSIYSTWTAILRASKVGSDAAAATQRIRIAVRNLEDSLVCIQCYAANQNLYAFVAENGDEAMLSFVARLPKSFPRTGKFGDLDLRRVTFQLEPSSGNSAKQLVMRQNPVVMEPDKDEKNHPLVLAKYVTEFKMEFPDPRNGQWIEEWKQTNALPKMVKITMGVADNERTLRKPQQIVRIVSIPSSTVQLQWQRGMMQGLPGQPGGLQPGQPGGQPGQPAPGQPGLIQPSPGGLTAPGFVNPGIGR